MAITGLSEFSFGFAFLFEQSQREWDELRAAPVLPSLSAEGNLGWDARLPRHGTDFYYQFKLTDYLHGWRATQIRSGDYASPYFRFPLYRRNHNHQHTMLKAHAQAHAHTYYVVPEFTDLTQFDASFLQRQVADHSRLIPLVDCDEITDDEQHYISFQTGIPGFKQHSKTTFHQRSESGAGLESLYLSSRREWRPIDDEFAAALFEQTVEKVGFLADRSVRGGQAALRLREPVAGPGARADYLRGVSELLAVYYGLTMVIVGEPPPEGA